MRRYLHLQRFHYFCLDPSSLFKKSRSNTTAFSSFTTATDHSNQIILLMSGLQRRQILNTRTRVTLNYSNSRNRSWKKHYTKLDLVFLKTSLNRDSMTVKHMYYLNLILLLRIKILEGANTQNRFTASALVWRYLP